MQARIYPTGWRPVAVVIIAAAVALTLVMRRPHAIEYGLRDMAASGGINRPYVQSSAPISDSSAPISEMKNTALDKVSGMAANEADASPARREVADGLRFPSTDPSAADASRMVIRSGWALIEVRSVDSVAPVVRMLANQVGGFVANSSMEGGREQARSARFEIKAPAQDFDRLVNGLRPLGKIESVNVTAQDVGEEYVDVNARMANDRRLEDRLLQLLATRTGKLKDVLDVEHEMARVREEIERQEGRLRYLRSRTDMSTLTVTIHEPVPIINQPGSNPIDAAARRAWRNFVALTAFAIASLGVVIPVGLLGMAAWWIFTRRRPMTATPVPAAPAAQ